MSFLLALDLVHHLTAPTHASAPWPYVFLAILDGFIALTIAAMVRLRPASFLNEQYAWRLMATAIAVRAVLVFVLHSLADRQGGGPWTLADFLILVMAACTPLIPVGAVHLYVLAAEHTARVPQPRATGASQERLRGGDV
ncbi:hypothetical protein H9Y04_17440 [Streptomyces sp. TRM66268-LWL]|uniref:Uncharacterized protein n=1 Tax=Streptomyces polyasparticus TaxID=2767826 RepID=A0ABR7SHB8_9ACTN|nr:hypothetical protein [Streptomyces polyasparticus]MBC9714347.1 hypothetical protein [Streptomyces polyasparticus]